MFVHNGAVTPGPSRECDITFFVKGRPKSGQQSRDCTVAARSAQSVTVLSSRVSRERRSPGLRSPPLKNARQNLLKSPHWNFAVKGASRPSPIPKFPVDTPAPPPPPPLLKGGGGEFYWKSQRRGFPGEGGVSTGNFGGGRGGCRGPFYREKEPPFRRKRLLTCFHFLPPLLATPPLSLLLLSAPFRPFLPSTKVVCSVEEGAQHRAWRGAVSGWTSPI